MIYSVPAACSNVWDLFLVLSPQALRAVSRIYNLLHDPLIIDTSLT
jgi:hypothetical protein